jgi:predicted transglutaminase-like protease
MVRKLQSEELYNLYSSPNIIRQIKLRIMRWAEHEAHMRKERKVYEVLVEKSE